MSKLKRVSSKHARAASRLESELSEADALIRRKAWAKARELLESLEKRHPNRPDVLSNLAYVYHRTDDRANYQRACARLVKLAPDDPEALLSLAGAYRGNLRPALALRAFQRFLDRWPDHERAQEAQQAVSILASSMDEILTSLGLAGEDGLELAALHEQVQVLLEQGDYVQVRKTAQDLLRRRPDFTPALNNLSQAYFWQGQLDQAMAASQRVLAIDPNNFHALSNLARYLCLSGRVSEAREWAERLKTVEPDLVDVWVKKAEALSLLGDDLGVLDALAGAERVGHLQAPKANPLLYHFAAVAAMRLGRESQARQYWKRALELQPGLGIAQENLADLRKPVGEQHAPWAFEIGNWIPQRTVLDLSTQMEPALRRGDEAMTKATRRFLRQHPEMVGLVPLLLDRGDPTGREFALRVALMAETPEMHAALRDFALSQRGPDPMRMQAASKATQAGLLQSGMKRMWLRGKWIESLMMGMEINGEPISRHRPQVERLLIEGTTALNRRDLLRAEQLLKQALEAEPDSPDILNNLAAVYGYQGREQEAESMLRQIHGRYPDYVFARTTLAHRHASRGEIEEAKALLEPLFSRKRMHTSEFTALCQAEVELALARGLPDSARSWLEMWERIDPGNPNLDYCRRRVGRPVRRSHPFEPGD